MEDSPRLELGDCPFDHVTNPVHLTVEGFLPVEEFAVFGFPDGGEHPASDVSLVAHPNARVEGVEDAGDPERGDVVAAPVDGVGDPREPAVQVADDLDVHACGAALAGVQLALVVP